MADAATTLYLVRHGNTFESWETPRQIGCQTDLALTSSGKDQAKKVGAYFKKQNVLPAKIFAGKLKRQAESARLIASELNLNSNTVETLPLLDEIDYGVWEGLAPDEIKAEWPKEYADWTGRAEFDPMLVPENVGERIAAIHSWIAALRGAFKPGSTVIAVTSNGVMRLFYSLLPKEWEELKAKAKLDDLKVKTGNFSELKIDSKSVSVKRWNTSPA